MDHAGTLGNAKNVYGGLSRNKSRASQLRTSVSGHDGAGEISHALFGRLARRNQTGEFSRDFFYRQRNSDNSGGGWKNFAGAQSEQSGQIPANLLAGSHTGFASSAVGIAGVHDHRSNRALTGQQ